jgi:hypothetical protein
METLQNFDNIDNYFSLFDDSIDVMSDTSLLTHFQSEESINITHKHQDQQTVNNSIF